jgi:uncharacterized protein YaaW (UPF0174 family)
MHFIYQFLKKGVWLSVGQYTVCNGTKTLGTGPIMWLIPINEGDGGAVM